MVFSSNAFLFLFLPLFLGIYYLTPFRFKSLVILIGSYAFYAWWRVDFLAIFIGVTGWNYWIGRALSSDSTCSIVSKRYLVLGVVGNLCTLGYFKYANFGVDSFNSILQWLGMETSGVVNVILPVGISFYIFQAISYVVDVYRKDTEPTHSLIDFAAFIALFPQLIAGPVLRYKDVANQFYFRVHTLDKFSEGVQRFMLGFVKKVFIADTIAGLADSAFALQDPSAADAWLGALAYTAQLYFDFSGYSDMAIGLGLMMGFRFKENFNNPYISQSITEFWQRWHISLSRWLKDYLYIPLGGNRNGMIITYRNLFLTMLLGGLWHGANWTFIVWGAWHGAWLAIERVLGLGDNQGKFNSVRWLVTFLLVMLGWVLFRAETIERAVSYYGALFSFNWVFTSSYLVDISRLQVSMLIVAYSMIVIFGLLSRSTLESLEKQTQEGGGAFMDKGEKHLSYIPVRSLTACFFVMACLKLSSQDYSPFLYFQF